MIEISSLVPGEAVRLGRECGSGAFLGLAPSIFKPRIKLI